MGDRIEGDGFISKVGVDGENLELKFIPQLNDPKGLLLQGNILWVTDNTEVVVMDVNTASVIARITVKDAKSLNDITVDKEGTLYFSDMGKNSIYKKDINGRILEWMNSEELCVPNGLLAVNGKLYVASWGESKNGNLLEVDLQEKIVKPVTTKGIGNLDGIQPINEREFYVSDWATGKIHRIDVKGNMKEILTSEKSAGDILFVKKDNQLILPMNHQNSLWWYQIK